MKVKRPAKRVDIVSLRLVKESSVLYPNRKINSPEDAAKLLEEFLADADREHFVAIYLNIKNEPTAIHTVSIGTLNSAQVHAREVFKGAMLANAAAIIIGHNHPSGDPTPSKEDTKITDALVDIGRIIGIEIIDHIIIGHGRFVSLKAKGMI